MYRTNVWTPSGESGGGAGGVMNWEIGIDMYTLICIKWITNKNLLYKKINKIKFKKKKRSANVLKVPWIIEKIWRYIEHNSRESLVLSVLYPRLEFLMLH